MGKAIPDVVLDAPLDSISEGDVLHICSAEPTNYTEATSTFSLGSVALVGGDFTKANGDTSGRKVTIGAKTGGTVSSNGTANHIAIVRTTGSVLKLVSTITTPQAVTTSNSFSTSAFKYEIQDPT